MDDLDDKQQVTQYLIPANVNARFELFPGFGWAEMKIVIAALVIGGILFYGLGLIKKTTILDPKIAPISQTMGAKPDTDGMIHKTTPLIPSAFRIFAIILPATAAFFFVKKDPSNNMSIMIQWKSRQELMKKQRVYMYKYNSGSED